MVWQKMCPRIVISSPPVVRCPSSSTESNHGNMSMSIFNHANFVLLRPSILVKIISSISIFDPPILCSNIWLLLYCCTLVPQVLI